MTLASAGLPWALVALGLVVGLAGWLWHELAAIKASKAGRATFCA